MTRTCPVCNAVYAPSDLVIPYQDNPKHPNADPDGRVTLSKVCRGCGDLLIYGGRIDGYFQAVPNPLEA